MTVTAGPHAIPFLPGGPEAMLHVGDVGGTAARASGAMRTGPWVVGLDGEASPGALGVLADVVWGGAAVACAPAGMWGVSTELALHFGAPVPADGSLLWAAGEAVHQDAHGALGVGSVKTADGRTVASGGQRTRFMAATAATRPPVPVLATPAGDHGIAALIGLERDEAGSLCLAASESVANPAGNIHGGILFCIAELAASDAIGARVAGLTAEALSLHYLRPGQVGETLRCETEVVHRGRTAATAVVRCRRGDGKICALGTVHYGPVDASKD